MRITQGYVSKSVMDFPFHQIYSLDDYKDQYDPAVFFGMYRYEDFVLALEHHSRSRIFLTGQDALDGTYIDEDMYFDTAHPKVYKRIHEKGSDCELVKPSAFLNSVQPQRLGKIIYAYCPASTPDYHGWPIIKQLQGAGYNIIFVNNPYSQFQWRYGKADEYYNPCFIGLCLSEFAGGGTSIIEMGLRGMKVVTNVFDLPNCIPWNSVEDIIQAIEEETKNIGTTNEKLARQVWDSLDHKHEWLEI